MNKIRIQIKTKTVAVSLVISICLLLLANIGTIVIQHSGDYSTVYRLTRSFNFDIERNVPTLFSFFLLLISSLLLLITSFTECKSEPSKNYWLGLSFLFLFLSIDEIISIHEGLSEPVRDLLGTSGILYFAWVIPYAFFTIILAVFYFKFFMSLPVKTRYYFFISAGFYLVGALGFELVGSWHYSSYGDAGLLFASIYTIEELFEMIGTALFISAICDYLNRHTSDLTLSFTN